MRHIVVSIDRGRTDKLRRMYRGLEIFPGVDGCSDDPEDYRKVCIPQAYRNVTEWAVSEGLGREAIVMQDDVWMPNGPGFDKWQAKYETPLLIFGQTEPDGGVAPKAFAASPEIWQLLAEVWDGEGRIIPAWMPIVKKYGKVLDVTRDLDG